MKRIIWPWIVSLLALGIAISAHFNGSPSTPQAASLSGVPTPTSSSRHARSAASSAPSDSPSVESPSSERRDPTAELIPLLTDIQQRLHDMEGRLLEMRPGWENLALRGMVNLTEQEIAEVRLRALDPARSDEDRLKDFNILRRQNGIDDSTAASMVQLAQTSTDADVREELYQRMEGLTNSVLRAPLLAALSTETNPNVREELVEALGGYRATDPEVESWLRHLAENDESESVRREARESLNERLRHMPVESIQDLVMQSNLSPEERLAAVEQLRRQDARSTEVVTSMVNLYASSEDPRIRAEIFNQLEGVNDPALRDPLIIGLAEDPDARVRREAADSLAAFVSDPDVKAWLEYTAANDKDPGVRRQASQSLRGGEDDRRGRGDRR